MVNERYWPFEIPSGHELSAEDRRDFGFLEAAFREGYQASIDEGGMARSAVAKNGREGVIVRRGGKGRYWEIILADKGEVIKAAFVDGFEPASSAVLSWLRGDDSSVAIGRIDLAIVKKPGK